MRRPAKTGHVGRKSLGRVPGFFLFRGEDVVNRAGRLWGSFPAWCLSEEGHSYFSA